jgi:hypothetical protein
MLAQKRQRLVCRRERQFQVVENIAGYCEVPNKEATVETIRALED